MPDQETRPVWRVHDDDITPTRADHARLTAATDAARQRMADHERDLASWRDSERHDGTEHISVVLRAVLVMRGLDRQESAL